MKVFQSQSNLRNIQPGLVLGEPLPLVEVCEHFTTIHVL